MVNQDGEQRGGRGSAEGAAAPGVPRLFGVRADVFRASRPLRARTGEPRMALPRTLLARERDYPEAFSFSILQISAHLRARSEVLGWGRRYKIKLGSGATGLNLN